jgi:hypothetical protein
MMPNVNIANPVFNRLQSKAVPLVDDLDTVLIRLLDFWDKHHGQESESSTMTQDDLTLRVYSADAPPDLTFTGIKSITVDGETFSSRYWNPLMFAVIGKAAEKIGKEKLKPHLEGNSSEKENKNYVQVPAAGLWVQGREANLCWRQINRVAKAAGIALEVEFFWPEDSKSSNAGKSGRFVVEAK